MRPNTYLLACLEILVHLDKSELPPEYVWSSAELPNEPELLGTEVGADLDDCRTAGRAWVEAANNLAVLVHSVVIPQEFNVLLNPSHSQYAELAWNNPQPFRFDHRLFAFGAEQH